MSSPSESGASDPIPSEPIPSDPIPSGRPAGVIHDIGYRPYHGPRHGEGPVAWSLFRTGLRNCYGLGRSGKSKVLPMVLLGLVLLPALILVGVLVQAGDALGLNTQILPYSRYPVTTNVLITVFVGSQAPALISRDLRFRTITLYLARPLRRSTYVLVRVASLTAAVFVFTALPLVLMYLGGLLADLPFGRETQDVAVALLGVLTLSAVLASVSALVSAVTTRRGLAVAAVVVVLLVTYTVVSAIQGIATETGNDTIAEVAGLFAPYSLVDGVLVFLFGIEESSPAPPTGTGMGMLYVLVTLVTIVGAVVAMLLRYRRTVAV